MGEKTWAWSNSTSRCVSPAEGPVHFTRGKWEEWVTFPAIIPKEGFLHQHDAPRFQLGCTSASPSPALPEPFSPSIGTSHFSTIQCMEIATRSTTERMPPSSAPPWGAVSTVRKPEWRGPWELHWSNYPDGGSTSEDCKLGRLCFQFPPPGSEVKTHFPSPRAHMSIRVHSFPCCRRVFLSAISIFERATETLLGFLQLTNHSGLSSLLGWLILGRWRLNRAKPPWAE